MPQIAKNCYQIKGGKKMVGKHLTQINKHVNILSSQCTFCEQNPTTKKKNWQVFAGRVRLGTMHLRTHQIFSREKNNFFLIILFEQNGISHSGALFRLPTPAKREDDSGIVKLH